MKDNLPSKMVIKCDHCDGLHKVVSEPREPSDAARVIMNAHHDHLCTGHCEHEGYEYDIAFSLTVYSEYRDYSVGVQGHNLRIACRDVTQLEEDRAKVREFKLPL